GHGRRIVLALRSFLPARILLAITGQIVLPRRTVFAGETVTARAACQGQAQSEEPDHADQGLLAHVVTPFPVRLPWRPRRDPRAASPRTVSVVKAGGTLPTGPGQVKSRLGCVGAWLFRKNACLGPAICFRLPLRYRPRPV